MTEKQYSSYMPTGVGAAPNTLIPTISPVQVAQTEKTILYNILTRFWPTLQKHKALSLQKLLHTLLMLRQKENVTFVDSRYTPEGKLKAISPKGHFSKVCQSKNSSPGINVTATNIIASSCLSTVTLTVKLNSGLFDTRRCEGFITDGITKIIHCNSQEVIANASLIMQTWGYKLGFTPLNQTNYTNTKFLMMFIMLCCHTWPQFPQTAFCLSGALNQR